MRLSRLRINRLPGIEHPFELEFRAGVNIVTGPNGSGKSSLTRAVFQLLWPGLQEIVPCDAVANFLHGETRWQAVIRDSRTVQWWRDDEPADPPDLPGSQSALFYRLGLLDIYIPEAGEDDRELARRLRRQMDGGFDLARTRDTLFPAATHPGRNEARKFKEASREVADVRRRFRELAASRRTLAQKEKELQDARLAKDRAELLTAIVEQKRRSAELADLQQDLAGFPAGVAHLVPEDPENFRKWRRQEEEARRELAGREQELADLEIRREELALPTEDFSLDLLHKQVETIESLWRERTRAGRELAGFDAALAGKNESTAGTPPTPVDRRTYNRLLELHGQLMAQEADLAVRQEQLARLARRPGTSFGPGWLLVLAGAALLTLGLWPGLAGPGPYTVLLLVLGGTSTASGLFFLGRKSDPDRARLAAELTAGLAKAQQDSENSRAELQDLATAHGLDLDNPDLVHDLKALGQRLEEQQQRKRIQGEIKRRDQEIQEVLARINSHLALAGLDPVDEIDTARQAWSELDRRLRDLERLNGEIKATTLARDNARDNAEGAAGAAAGILQRLRCRPSAGATEIETLAVSRQAWEKTRQEIAAAEAEIQARERRIAELAGLLDVDAARALSSPELTARIEEEKQLAGRAEALQEQINEVKGSIQAAVQGDSLSRAMARAESRRLALAGKREEARRSALGRLLLAQVHRQSETRSRPPVLQEARELLRTFTGNRYQLLTVGGPDGPGGFRARDNDSGLVLELGQLSDGTRAQLLLAVRLGFIFRTESGLRPPLFLDDCLTSSDPERLAAIAASLGRLSRERDRQVIFLTPDPVDAAAWQQALTRAGLPPAHLLDLAQARHLEVQAVVSDLEPGPPAEVPPPGGRPAAEYGLALGVPTLDPWAPPEGVHLFHLLEDNLELLHSLLTVGIPTAGRWQAARRWLVTGKILTPAQDDLVAVRWEIWSALLEAWRTGRGRPVAMADIDDSGAVSTTMRKRVAEVLRDCGGDGRKLLTALRQGQVKRFQESKKEQLQNYLELNGFVDARDVLDTDGLVRQTLAAVAHLMASGTVSPGQVRELTLTLTHRLDSTIGNAD